MRMRLSGLKLQGLGQLRRKIDMRRVAFGDESVVVVLAASCNGIVNLDDPFLRNEDGI
jgi:hypothetical protein